MKEMNTTYRKIFIFSKIVIRINKSKISNKYICKLNENILCWK